MQASATTVLLVDDEQSVLEVVAALSEDHGHKVTQAESPAGALAVLDLGLVVDALVTDLSMPGDMDGIDLVQEARRADLACRPF